MRWAAYGLQLATVKLYMCVVALTASIAACNIKLVDDLSPVRQRTHTEQILAAPAHQHRVFWGYMYDVTLKNRVKGINWHTAVFIALFHVGAVAAFFVFNWKAALEGGPIYWVVTHRIHHAHADAPGDPHTPRDGGWWSHMG